MPSAIVDTNVLVVANENERRTNASSECRLACQQALREIERSGMVVLDQQDEILREYIRQIHRASSSGQPGVGKAFLIWILTSKHNPNRCRLVAITPDEEREFVEFPDDPDLTTFDRSDRKFVAVAIVHQHQYGETAPILNAVDSDWWHARTALARHAIQITFLCDDQRQRWME